MWFHVILFVNSGNSVLKLVYKSTAHNVVDREQDLKNLTDLQGEVECYITTIIDILVTLGLLLIFQLLMKVGKSLRE